MKNENIEINIKNLCTLLEKCKINITEVIKIKEDFNKLISNILNKNYKISDSGLYSILMCALDVYTYSNNGEVLISDREYDMLHYMWTKRGFSPIIYPHFNNTEWKIKKHSYPQLVGSISKIYNKDEMLAYIENSIRLLFLDNKENVWVLSPKYDGVSAIIEFDENGEIISGTTRGDGINGQDITMLICQISNINDLKDIYANNVLKTELCVPENLFKELKDIGYANRRSATTAIVNTPKNLKYAHCIEAIPLLSLNKENYEINYDPKNSILLENYKSRDLLETSLEFLMAIKNNKYEYRIDGIILYPKYLDISETMDYMSSAKAYKINTAEAFTHIKRGYVSIGRKGFATPMLEVEPCEVNETEVTDISLGSFPKFYSYHLHENEVIRIFSAGDVIPQYDMHYDGKYPKDANLISIPEICPYCNSELDHSTYKCINPLCIRLKTGKITTFIKIMGIDDISDATIETLCINGLIENISDLFKLKVDDIKNLPGFGLKSANNIINNINLLKTNKYEKSKFIASLSIPGISEKLSRILLYHIPLEDLIQLNGNYLMSIADKIINIDGFGYTRAEQIIDYIKTNYVEIMKLMSIINFIEDITYYGNIVFTGFRDIEWENKFNTLGFNRSDNINKETKCVISSDMNKDKVKKALARNIPVYSVFNIRQAYEDIKKALNK